MPTRRWLPLLTLATLLTHGFHPLAEDGGLYVAGIQYKLDPTLFPKYTAFVTEHLHFSLFAPIIATTTSLTHIPLPTTLFLFNLLSIALTLYAALEILSTLFPENKAAQLAGTALLAAWWTLPIAGTSLLLMDPYLTARSFSTPLSLLAIAYALSKSHTRTILCLALAAAFHPLMAAYALAFILALNLPHTRKSILTLTTLALAAAALIQHVAPAESPAIRAAEITRYYWFLSQWQWFELLGLLGPLAILAAYTRNSNPSIKTLTRTAILVGSIAILIAILFAHQDSPTHLVARLQPLRIFLLLYALMALLLGASLYQLCERHRQRALPAAVIFAMAATMFYVQRETFPLSQHLELPGRDPNPNPWSQAFRWARDNTPPNALFALDAKYVNTEGEDAQTFRATALRSALPDYSKDGGEASITPTLAAQWYPAAIAQKDLSHQPDALRDANLAPFHPTWMILHADAPTQHPCPYANLTVKVCRLDP